MFLICISSSIHHSCFAKLGSCLMGRFPSSLQFFDEMRNMYLVASSISSLSLLLFSLDSRRNIKSLGRGKKKGTEKEKLGWYPTCFASYFCPQTVFWPSLCRFFYAARFFWGGLDTPNSSMSTVFVVILVRVGVFIWCWFGVRRQASKRADCSIWICMTVWFTIWIPLLSFFSFLFTSTQLRTSQLYLLLLSIITHATRARVFSSPPSLVGTFFIILLRSLVDGSKEYYGANWTSFLAWKGGYIYMRIMASNGMYYTWHRRLDDWVRTRSVRPSLACGAGADYSCGWGGIFTWEDGDGG